MASPGEQDTRDENIQGKEVPRRRQEWLQRRLPDREAEEGREAEGRVRQVGARTLVFTATKGPGQGGFCCVKTRTKYGRADAGDPWGLGCGIQARGLVWASVGLGIKSEGRTAGYSWIGQWQPAGATVWSPNDCHQLRWG